MSARAITKALRGQWHGSYGTALCPAHDDHTPSLSIRDGDDGRLLTNCFGGCDPVAVWDAFRRQGLVGDRDRIVPEPRQSGIRIPVSDNTDRTTDALAIWNASILATGTPAAEYLCCRGITIPPPNNIRYHEAEHMLVAAVRQSDCTLTGIQRIYLTTDSRGTWKRSRLSLGLCKGGAVRLSAPADWDGTVQLTESVEDGLALLQLTGKPTWAVPGAGFLADVELPPEVRTIVLAPDNDKAGQDAIERAETILTGVEVKRLLPPAGMDWCNVLEAFEERAGIREFSGGADRQTAEQEAIAEVRP